MPYMTVSGTVKRTIYRNDKNSYSVIALTVADNVFPDYSVNGEIVITGYLDRVKPGDHVTAYGNFEDNPQHGTRFAVERIEIETITESITGTVNHVIFYSDDTGYTVLEVIPEDVITTDAEYWNALDSDGSLKVVGTMPMMDAGERATFTGRWVDNPQYGRQFRADTVIPLAPDSEAGIVRYLAENVHGVGDVTAQRIYDYLGEDTMQILDTDPQRIYDVPGLKKSVADNVLAVWSENRIERQVMVYLQSFGITARMARKIFELYGELTPQHIEEDPYRLADELHGVGFKKADEIAQRFGIELDSPQRVRAGITYTLKNMTNEGHVYATRSKLIPAVNMELSIDDPVLVEQILEQQIFRGDLVEDMLPTDGHPIRAVYLPAYYKSEVRAAGKLFEMVRTESDLIKNMKGVDWGDYLQDLLLGQNVQLSDEQQGAVQAVLSSKLTVLTGGPGTGKTTTLNIVIQALEQERCKFRLASPTGRAAKRLTETVRIEEDSDDPQRKAVTIHRLLGWSPTEGGFEHDETNPLDIDVLVVDESSMIDLWLFDALLRALKPETHLMLVGDVDQLPSVGAGNVLRDVIDSGLASVIRLSRIFRQHNTSHIVTNAHRINQGQNPLLNNRSNDFFFFSVSDADEVVDQVVDIVAQRLEKVIGKYDPLTDVQVLAPMYRGPAGVNVLNERLRERLNPNPNERKAERRLSGTLFRVGDKVMQTKNNYEREVFNGDIGFIKSFNFEESSLLIEMDGRDIVYDFADAEELIHAYCISTHRSQGSEYRVVVMPILARHYVMLQRNLLYTAITRASEVVVLIGEKRAVSRAVKNNEVSNRFSGLVPRLRYGVIK